MFMFCFKNCISTLSSCKNSLEVFTCALYLTGDLGPVYGFQWRHFGAEYKDMHTDYSGKGIDQLHDVIDKIKNNPDDRRIIMSAWNPLGKRTGLSCIKNLFSQTLRV